MPATLFLEPDPLHAGERFQVHMHLPAGDAEPGATYWLTCPARGLVLDKDSDIVPPHAVGDVTLTFESRDGFAAEGMYEFSVANRADLLAEVASLAYEVLPAPMRDAQPAPEQAAPGADRVPRQAAPPQEAQEVDRVPRQAVPSDAYNWLSVAPAIMMSLFILVVTMFLMLCPVIAIMLIAKAGTSVAAQDRAASSVSPATTPVTEALAEVTGSMLIYGAIGVGVALLLMGAIVLIRRCGRGERTVRLPRAS